MTNDDTQLAEAVEAFVRPYRERGNPYVQVDHPLFHELLRRAFTPFLDRLAAVETDRDEALDDAREADAANEVLSGLKPRVRALEGALRKYGRHADRCQTGRLDTITAGVSCVCGLSAALAERRIGT